MVETPLAASIPAARISNGGDSTSRCYHCTNDQLWWRHNQPPVLLYQGSAKIGMPPAAVTIVPGISYGVDSTGTVVSGTTRSWQLYERSATAGTPPAVDSCAIICEHAIYTGQPHTGGKWDGKKVANDRPPVACQPAGCP
jgi:hypothetical protein